MPSAKRKIKASTRVATASASQPPPAEQYRDWEAVLGVAYATFTTLAITSQATDVALWTLPLLVPLLLLLGLSIRDSAPSTDAITRRWRMRWSLIYAALVSLLVTATAGEVASWTMPLWTPIAMLIASASTTNTSNDNALKPKAS